MSIVSAIASFGRGVVSPITDTVVHLKGSKREQETHLNEEQMAVYQMAAAENMADRPNRTIWDSFIDGLNRLPRPLFAFGALWMLYWPIHDPAQFAVAMQGYALLPMWLAAVIGQIILFFFGGRMLDKFTGNKTGPTPEQVKAVLDSQERIRKVRSKSVTESAKPLMDDDDFEEEMADTSKPLSNTAILEWNRRNGKN